ncbi:hypothetical protein SAMN06265365_10958 [Tistlia consotensis]|uniref:N-acetyltransferase domain-containing protein n=1 Tax=Tistlia consotensis USBA 355 TaxID=560819 RepID=A0A1Y6CKB7_9PROT|nr:hypothetical protein [Tistlia consotensis]SMF58300.1 hypothetical protein SAMN05428998_1229 [Tistlia consotensis USBA 355]SNR63066.1 hypothetical protein SAMN06265365_10958 [Tistlia consotensis]
MTATNLFSTARDLSNGHRICTGMVNHAEAWAERNGLSLILHGDLTGLPEVNASYRHLGWFGLMPMFNPARFEGGEAFWIEGRDRDGRCLTVQAARHYHLNGSLTEALEDLSLFYSPHERASAGESCTCTVPEAETITGSLVYSGSTFAHPDLRGRGVAKVMPRLSRALAWLLWRQRTTISMVDPVLIEKGVVAAYGYRRIGRDIIWRGSVDQGDLDLALIWMDEEEAMADASRIIESAEARV